MEPAGVPAPAEAPADEDDRRRAVRRFARAAAGGGAAAMAVLTWLSLRGSADLLARHESGQFYEVQARAWLDGRWDVPGDSIGAERFNVGGRFYEYFGPFPALLRVPFVALTDSLDGRLARLFSLVGCALILAAVTWLLWLVRRAIGRTGEPTRLELAATAGFVLVAGCGSIVVYLSGWPAVYHEAIIWGVAWALVSSALLVGYLLDRRTIHLVLASMAAACSILSRGSVGAGPIVAIGLVGVWRFIEAVRARELPLRSLGGLAAAALVPYGLYGWVNQVKFGSPFALPPFDKQDLLIHWPSRGPAMAANHGTLFGWGYAPTIALQYLRPDGVTFDRLFPWVWFEREPRVLGGAVFEALNPSASIPAASTLLVVLAAVGAVAVVRRRGLVLVAPIIGAAVGAVGAFSLAFVDQRYQADVLPLLVLPAVLGFWVMLGAVERWRRPAGAAIVVVALALGAWSCWVNSSLSYLYQRSLAPDASADLRAGMVSTQLAVHEALFDIPPSRVQQADTVGPPGPRGSLFVLRACDGVLWSTGRDGWRWVERTASTGHIALDAAPPGQGRWPLVSSTDGQSTTIVWVRVFPDGRLWFEHEWWGEGAATAEVVTGEPVQWTGRGAIDVLLDQQSFVRSVVVVRLDGQVVLEADALVAPGAVAYGAQARSASAASTWPSEVEPRAVDTPICDRPVDVGAVDR
jgi:hypothetical protein